MALTSSFDAFNPGVKAVDPGDYTKLTHVIEQPKFISTTGQALSQGGDILEGGIKATDEVVKAKVRDDVHEAVDPQRDAFAKGLTNVKTALVDSKQQASLLQRVDVNGQPIATEEQTPKNLPEDLKRLPQTLSALQGASLSGGGKVSETYYYGRLAQITTDLRSKYPTGYRDYIDKQVEGITGVDPANAYIKSIISDINHGLTEGKTERNNLIAQYEKNWGMPGVDHMINGIRSGTISLPTATTWLNNALGRKYEIENNKAEMDNSKTTDEYRAQKAADVAQGIAAQHVTDGLATMFTMGGYSDIKSVSDLKKSNITSDKAIELGNVVEAGKLDLETGLRNKFFMPQAKSENNPFGYSLARIMGADKANKIIDDNMKIHASVVKFLKGGDISLAATATHLVKAQQDEATKYLYTHTELGRDALLVHSINASFGDQTTAAVFGSTLTATMPAKFQAYVASKNVNAAAGAPNPQTGEVPTLKGDVEDARSKGLTGKLLGTTNEEFVRHVEMIADPKTPAELKKRYVDYAFKPSNAGYIRQMESASIDPITGKPSTDGKFSMFRRLTSPDMTDAIKALGPEAWNKYKDTIQSAYSLEVFQPAVQQLNSIQNNPDAVLSWDETNHRFGLDIGRNKNLQHPSNEPRFHLGFDNRPENDPAIQKARRTIQELNSAIYNISHLAVAEGRDPTTYIMDILTHPSMGFDPTLGTTSGMPQKMMDAINAGKQDVEAKKKQLRERYKPAEAVK